GAAAGGRTEVFVRSGDRRSEKALARTPRALRVGARGGGWTACVLDAPARKLLHGPGRPRLSILSVASAIALVLVFEGFRTGLYREIRDFPAEMPADLIAMQAGVSNLLGARSVLPRRARAEVEAVPGVKVAHPLGGIPLIYTHGARRGTG